MKEYFSFAILNGVRYLVAPEDFFEYLEDCGYTFSIEMKELMEVLDDWIEE